MKRALGEVVEVVPGVEDSGEWLEVEDVSVRMMWGRGSSKLGTAVVTIPHSGDSGLGPGGEPGPGGGSWPDMLRHDIYWSVQNTYVGIILTRNNN